jgi:lipopolysaccharide heptosyltransferase II
LNNVISNYKKILIVKLCCIGDAVFITPLLRGLRSSFPSAEISYLASGWIKNIVEQVHYVDRVITYDAPFKNGMLCKLKDTINLIKELRKNKYDVVIIGHRNPFFSIVGLLAGINVRVGFSSKYCWLLTHTTKFDPSSYEIDRYLNLLKLLGIKYESQRTEIHPLEDEIKLVKEKLVEYNIGEKCKIVGLFPGGGENPGTSMSIKRWDLDSYVELSKLILKNSSSVIFLLGGNDDERLNKSIETKIGTLEARVFNLTGKFGLRSLPALLQRCSVVVGGDSGPVHIAAAVGTPTIFLFGPSDPRLVAPKNSNSVYLWKQVSCSPCYTPTTVQDKKNFDGKTFFCWTGTKECLESISVGEVYNTLTSLLSL